LTFRRRILRLELPVGAWLSAACVRSIIAIGITNSGVKANVVIKAQGDGRDHHIKGFSFLLAGGSIKGGIKAASATAPPTSCATPRSNTPLPCRICMPPCARPGYRPQARGAANLGCKLAR
jgi:hypothetical protein